MKKPAFPKENSDDHNVLAQHIARLNEYIDWLEARRGGSDRSRNVAGAQPSPWPGDCRPHGIGEHD